MSSMTVGAISGEGVVQLVLWFHWTEARYSSPPHPLIILQMAPFKTGLKHCSVLITTSLFVRCSFPLFFSGALPHFTPCCLFPCASSSSSSACRPRRRCSSRYLSFSFSVRRLSTSGDSSPTTAASKPRLNPSRRVDISLVRRRICCSWAVKRAARHSAIFKRPP